MKRLAPFVLTLVALGAALALCACSPTGGQDATSGEKGGAETSAKPTASDPYAELESAGPNEKAAYAAVPAALAEAAERTKGMGKTPTDLSGGEPRLYAYSLRATVGDQVTLFEVRKDGKAYPLYAWGREPDLTKLVWTSVSLSDPSAQVDAASAPEKAAVAAVEAVMAEVTPGKSAAVKLDGYYFVFVGAGGKIVKSATGQDWVLGITPQGQLAMWSD